MLDFDDEAVFTFEFAAGVVVARFGMALFIALVVMGAVIEYAAGSQSQKQGQRGEQFGGFHKSNSKSKWKNAAAGQTETMLIRLAAAGNIT